MHFPSGIAGVVVITLALMGSIGVGFLLNGASDFETVNDYDHVTDVSGLYTYTPVTAFADYSPATNNYQYSTTFNNLGTYTSGISYTPAGSANLNPIITPSSGVVPITGSFDLYASDSNNNAASASFVGFRLVNGAPVSSPTLHYNDRTWVGTVADFLTLNGVSSFDTLTLPTSVQSYTGLGYSGSMAFQQLGVLHNSSAGTINAAYEAATEHQASATYYNSQLIIFPASTHTVTFGQNSYSNTLAEGYTTDLICNGNGTVSFQYIKGNDITYITAQASELYIYAMAFSNGVYGSASVSPLIYSFNYSGSVYGDIDYLDPNYGVSPTGSPIYWKNGYENGAVAWMFQKPTATNAYRFTSYTSSGSLNTWTISYDGQWKLHYVDSSGTTKVVSFGSSWAALRVQEDYAGVLTVSPVKGFTNFTSYTLGNSSHYSQYRSAASGIQYYSIQSGSSTSMKMAVVNTTVHTGTVLGAMYNASLTLANYFPNMAAARISFDSAAYLGTSVSVSTWTMQVDAAQFTGTFTLDGRQYNVDLTKPWNITWNEDGSVSIEFTQTKRAGHTTVEIFSESVPKVINLDGQWIIDTDLYNVSSHTEEVFDWQFGSWGLDSKTFIVCAIGLIALLAVGFKLGGVPMNLLDLLIIFGGVAIMWVIL